MDSAESNTGGGQEGSATGAVILDSDLTCPRCGHVTRARMPEDACIFFHECEGCGTLLRPKPGDCCVFCSYGSVPCPPVQRGGADACCG